MKLLCAEDNATLRKMIELMLAPSGIEVDFVLNGRLVIEAYENSEYDAVLMDFDMPLMNGIDAALAIRAIELSNHINPTPILFMMGHDDAHHYKDAIIKAGGDGYIIKPFTTQLLLEGIGGVLSAHKRHRFEDLLRLFRQQ